MQVLNTKGHLLGWWFMSVHPNIEGRCIIHETYSLPVTGPDEPSFMRLIGCLSFKVVDQPFEMRCQNPKGWSERFLVHDDVPEWFWKEREAVQFAGWEGLPFQGVG